MLAAGVPGVLIGAMSVVDWDESMATAALGTLTLTLGCYSIFKPNLGLESGFRGLSVKDALVSAVGFYAIGFLNGSLTSGTGLFVALWLVSVLRLDYKTAIAHTLVWVGLVWNGSGALALGLMIEVQWFWLPALVLGSLFGGYLGAHLSIVHSASLIKRAFEVITVTTGILLVVKAVTGG